MVTVTSHPASLDGFSSEVLSTNSVEKISSREEWRVLRFNSVTRQSVTRVKVLNRYSNQHLVDNQQQRPWLEDSHHVVAVPDCLAQEYLKSMASVLAALLGLFRLLPPSMDGSGGKSTLRSNPQRGDATVIEPTLRVLCIGLGGGTFPLFLHYHFPFAEIDAVEIDPVVVEATSVMGVHLGTVRPRLRVYTQDAIEFLKGLQLTDANQTYDVVCVDAFDGDDTIPNGLLTAEVASLIAGVMEAQRSVLIMNAHGVDVRGPARIFRDAMMVSNEPVRAFTVSTQKQQNITLACIRGESGSTLTKDALRLLASYVSSEVGYRFSAGRRACRNYAVLL